MKLDILNSKCKLRTQYFGGGEREIVVGKLDQWGWENTEVWDLGNILLGFAKSSSGVGKIQQWGHGKIQLWGWENTVVGLGK